MSALPLTVDVEPLSGAGIRPRRPRLGDRRPLIRGADRPGRTGREPVVLRHRLFHRLAAAGAVTLVSAPAGEREDVLVRS